jgi:hypothetical protein
MRKIALLVLSFFIFSSVILAQEIIENSEKPLSKNAGRIVDLQDVLSIHDEGDAYYFKYPSNLKIAPDGSIFVLDWMSNQLLQFGTNGKFLRNFFKKGQGPGELSSVSDFFFEGNNIIIYDARLRKILWLNFNGEAVKEFKVRRKTRGFMFELYHQDTYYFIQYNVQFTMKKPSYVDVPYYLTSISEDGNEAHKLTSFLLKAYVVPGMGGGGGVFNLEKMITAPLANRYLFISHSAEYLVKLFDAATNKIIHSFNREYKRVKPSSDYKERMKKGSFGIDGKEYTEPDRKYLNDIQNLFVNQKMLWVMTSTMDKKKGILFDVFDLEGRYVDKFYVKFTEENFPQGGINRMAVAGEFLYQIETTPEETYVIKKYKMEDLT